MIASFSVALWPVLRIADFVNRTEVFIISGVRISAAFANPIIA